jgi:hypothetical protein
MLVTIGVSVLEIGIYLCADNELTPDWYILIVILGVLVGLMSIHATILFGSRTASL